MPSCYTHTPNPEHLSYTCHGLTPSPLPPIQLSHKSLSPLKYSPFAALLHTPFSQNIHPRLPASHILSYLTSIIHPSLIVSNTLPYTCHHSYTHSSFLIIYLSHTFETSHTPPIRYPSYMSLFISPALLHYLSYNADKLLSLFIQPLATAFHITLP